MILKFIYSFEKQNDRAGGAREEKQNQIPSTALAPKWPQEPCMPLVEIRSQEQLPDFPHKIQGPKHLNHPLLCSPSHQQETGLEVGQQGLYSNPGAGCHHFKQELNILQHSIRPNRFLLKHNTGSSPLLVSLE